MVLFDGGAAPNVRCVVLRPWQNCALAAALVMLSLSAQARASPPPQINPGEVTANTKLSPTVSRALMQFVTDYNA